MTKMKKVMVLFVSLMAMLSLFQTAAVAADAKRKFKKTTGQVVSATPASIVVQGRAKQPLTLAVNADTEFIGTKTVKAGDKATVNYRVDKNGKTATRIKVLNQAATQPEAAPAAATSPAPQKGN